LKLLVSGEQRTVEVKNGWAHLEIKSILDHEVIVIA
jgi:hypothetical protein